MPVPCMIFKMYFIPILVPKERNPSSLNDVFSAEALVPSPLAVAVREKESNKQILVSIHFSETENSVKSKKMSWEQNRNLNLPKVQKLDLQRVQKLQLPDPMNQSLPNGKLPSSAPAVSLVAEESRPDTSFANRLDERRLIN